MSSLDTDFARAQFPALDTDWALFDNAGGSVTPRFVIDRVRDYMTTNMVQLGASYPASVRGGEQVVAGHAAAATLVGAEPDEVVLGHSTTVNAQVLARATRAYVGDGPIVVTNVDHESNLHPWRLLAEDGVEVRTWKFDPETALLRVEDLEPLLDGARLVCFSQTSNVVGAIHDVPAITARAHAAGARVVVDGVAFAPHRRVDVRAWDVDYYLCSLYKIYGPHIGCMYGKRELLLEARGQYNGCIPEDQIPKKLEPGNATHELAAGVPGILEYLEALHDHHFEARDGMGARLDRVFGLIARHESELVAPLLAFLDGHPKISVIGPTSADADVRVPTVAFTVEGRDASEIPPLLEKASVAVRYGNFHAYAPLRDMGLIDRGGAVRVSMVHYNTHEEVQRLIEALDTSI